MNLKNVKNLKISAKLILSFLIIIILAWLLSYISNIGIEQRNIEKTTKENVDYVKSVFNNLEEVDTKMLSSALEVIIQDPALKRIYLEKDREKLYNYGKALFQNIKTKYGITHWYFILPDGHTFLRMHNKDIYGDEITRYTFLRARDTGKTGSGIELGKTAYALRVVMPYYNGSELIGYLELGEGIDHFLEILKSETSNEFVIVADKENLNMEKWASVRNVAGLRNNWNDSESYLVISPPEPDKAVLECFTDENLKEGEKGKVLFQRLKGNTKFFRCAGLSLVDAGGRQSGMLLLLIDISSYIDIAKASNKIIFVFSMILFTLIVLINYFIRPYD